MQSRMAGIYDHVIREFTIEKLSAKYRSLNIEIMKWIKGCYDVVDGGPHRHINGLLSNWCMYL